MRTGNGWSAADVACKLLHGRWMAAEDVSRQGTIQSISNALRHAYERGWVERRRERPNNHRSRFLWKITVAGRTLFNRPAPQ